jgi:hypothetical protein
LNVFCLGSEQIEPLWNEFAHHLYRLEREGPLLADELRADLRDGTNQLWGLQEGTRITGVVITRITGRTCEVIGAAGSAPQDAMRELHRAIEEWAKDIGCSRMRLQGRKGWIRVLNYRQTGIIAEKEL